MIQKSFVMMKPDAVQRRLMGKILSRFEEKGLQIVAVKLMQIDEDLAKTHYGEHADKPFFGSLIEYITSSPSLAMVIEGEEAISTIRKLVGATNPLEADLGTIRGDFAMDTGQKHYSSFYFSRFCRKKNQFYSLMKMKFAITKSLITN